jgi:hypothetical protein
MREYKEYENGETISVNGKTYVAEMYYKECCSPDCDLRECVSKGGTSVYVCHMPGDVRCGEFQLWRSVGKED